MKYLGIESFLGHTNLHTHVTSPSTHTPSPQIFLFPLPPKLTILLGVHFWPITPYPSPPTPKSQTLYA